VLHQPVMVLLGFFVRSWAISPVVKFGLLYLVAFALTLGLYHYVVRPFAVVQFLFGVKAPRKSAPTEKAAYRRGAPRRRRSAVDEQ
jgi:glucan biosynthesis protein C